MSVSETSSVVSCEFRIGNALRLSDCFRCTPDIVDGAGDLCAFLEISPAFGLTTPACGRFDG
jgi:hypothetical protein